MESTSSSSCNKDEKVGQQSKKQNKTNASDYMNYIPDALVFHILSLLPLRELMIMSLVSKRWKDTVVRYLSLVPSSLNLEECKMPGTILKRNQQCLLHGKFSRSFNSLQQQYCLIHTAKKKFIEFVDLCFQLHSGCTINNLQFSVLYEAGGDYGYTRKLDSWVHLAFTNNIIELSLDFSEIKLYDPSAQPYKLPHGCFAPKILRTLNLNFCKFKPSSFQVFECLKRISLVQVQIFDCSFAQLASKCSVLEDVNLENCVFPDEFMMSNEDVMVEKLSVINCKTHKWEMYGIDLSTPCLLKLKIIGDYLMASHIRNAKELLDVIIGIKEILADALGSLMTGLSHCRSLTVNNWCIQVLPAGNDMLEGLPTYLNNLKHLHLLVGLAKQELPGISCLFRSSPNLENLTIHMLESENADWEQLQEDAPPIFDFEERIYWDEQNSNFSCLQDSLKKVTITGFSGSKNEMKLIQFLLKKARILQKMKVVSVPTDLKEEYTRIEYLIQRLFYFPRASSQASIEIY